MTPTAREWAETIAERSPNEDINLFLVTTEDTIREVMKNGQDEERRIAVAFLREAAHGWVNPAMRDVVEDLADLIAEGAHVLRAETGALDDYLGVSESD